MQADRRRKEVQSPPICAFSLTTQMGAIIRTEINRGTQKLYRQVSLPRRHLNQGPVQCQREISLRILENHRVWSLDLIKRSAPHFQPPFWKLAFVFWFSFPSNLFSCQRDLSSLPYPWHHPIEFHAGLLVVLFSKPTWGSPFACFVSCISLGNGNCASKM